MKRDKLNGNSFGAFFYKRHFKNSQDVRQPKTVAVVPAG